MYDENWDTKIDWKVTTLYGGHRGHRVLEKAVKAIKNRSS